MNYLILTIIYLLCPVYSADDEISERIVGGDEVMPKYKYNFITSLQRDDFHFCGGTIVTRTVVLSAAHCVHNYTGIRVEAVFHRHNLTETDQQERGIRRKVIDFRIHPEFTKKTIFHDLAIWKLDRPVNFKSDIFLDNGKQPLSRTKLAKVIGWGTTRSFGKPSKVLLETEIPFFDLKKCHSIYTGVGRQVNLQTQVCAGFPFGGHDTCQGDSGGPLFINRRGRMVLVGIVSWGVGCALPNYPGVYTKISAYLDWIINTL